MIRKWQGNYNGNTCYVIWGTRKNLLEANNNVRKNTRTMTQRKIFRMLTELLTWWNWKQMRWEATLKMVCIQNLGHSYPVCSSTYILTVCVRPMFVWAFLYVSGARNIHVNCFPERQVLLKFSRYFNTPVHLEQNTF